MFNNKQIDPVLAARSFVNPLTALCLRERVSELAKKFKGGESQKSLLFFLGAESNLGRIFLKLMITEKLQNLELVPLFRNSSLATDVGTL